MRRARSLGLLVGVVCAGMVLASCASSATGGTTQSSDASSQPSSSQSEASSSDAPSSAASSSAASSSDAAPSSDAGSGSTGTVKLGLAYDLGGRGDQSFNDSAARGLDKATGEGMKLIGELTAANGEPDSAKVDRLNQLVKDGANTIVAVGFAYAGALAEVAPKNPKVSFGIVDDASLCTPEADGGVKGAPYANVDCMTFAEEQGSFLVGVAAGLKTKSGKVGFIGGVDVPLIQKFQAGFDAGVKAVKPDATISDKYITEPPDFGGFNDPASGEKIAKGMYDAGTDVIYAAAGGSGAGVFKAAKAAKAWGIGVDSDQYNSPSLADVKDVIMTSMVKNVDVAVYDFFKSADSGSPLNGHHLYDLKTGGVAVATSGGFIDSIASQIDSYKQKIISGEIKVPTSIG
ncbi:MAG: BMP family ABC transporter substrate-binding protein [Nakamurella sp.]